MILSLAPMCNYPPHDGASQRVVSIAEVLCTAGHQVTLVGNDFILRLVPSANGSVSSTVNLSITRFQIGWRSKRQSALRTLCTSGHYCETKFTNPDWERIVCNLVAHTRPDVVVVNFIWMMSVLDRIKLYPQLIVCDTHNSEWRMFDNFVRTSKNPIVRRMSKTSKARYTELNRTLRSDTVLMHIAQTDLDDHKAHRPDLAHILVPACVGAVNPRTVTPEYGAVPKQLLFCGSLSNIMNLKALEYFARKFWPTVQPLAQLTVAGSSPSSRITYMCDKFGWHLEADFDDHRKSELYNAAHFAILPYEFGDGSKLKLLEACSLGIPTLTTSGGNCGNLQVPPFVTVSDTASDWYNAICHTVYSGDWRRAAGVFNAMYSPGSATAQLLDLL